LYDSYHRDAINHGATDKRANLEPRMVREHVEGMNGIFKWISSEPQFGDCLLKIPACQFLCGHLTHGAVDPKYTVSKKKIAAQRYKNWNEFATTNATPSFTPFPSKQPHVVTADVLAPQMCLRSAPVFSHG